MSRLSRDFSRSLRDWRRSVGGRDVADVLAPEHGYIIIGERDSIHRNRFDYVSLREARRDFSRPHQTRVDVLWAALYAALKPKAGHEALRAFLWLAIRWDYAPTFSELSAGK